MRRVKMQEMDEAFARRRPRDANGVVIGADSIQLDARGERAVLLLHGFNDTPQSVAYLAQRLHAAGYTVHAPRLPGHGVSLAQMARDQRFEKWRFAVADAHKALTERHARVFLCGQSMGGALAVLESVDHPPPALALLAPYIGVRFAMRMKFLAASVAQPFSAYLPNSGGARSIHDDAARAEALGPGLVTSITLRSLQEVALSAEAALPKLQVPTLYLQSKHDNRILAADAERHFAAIGSREKQQRWFANSGHILSVDFEREIVADAVIEWFSRH